ncbi:acyl-CoA dehydrogenase family protein [Mycobacterium sp. NPDC003449]
MTSLDRDVAGELTRSVRAACVEFVAEERIRAFALGRESGFGRELWRSLCRNIGVAGIGIPEHLGGEGYGAVAQGVVARELGRMLAPVPFVASAVLASGLLVDSEAEDAIASLNDGEITAAAIITSDGGSWNRSSVGLSAARRGDGWIVNGNARHVLHGESADCFVALADNAGQLVVAFIDGSASGVSTATERVLDGTRPMATVTFTEAPAQLLLQSEPATKAVERNVARAIAVLSAEQVGACERALEITAEYARTREQFGHPIGGYQAVKHMCADVLVELEWARSASDAALLAADEGDLDEMIWRASLAKAVCSEALRRAAHVSVQVHGGIGFSWEGPPHPYLRRARTDEVLFGTPSSHWTRLAEHALPLHQG